VWHNSQSVEELISPVGSTKKRQTFFARLEETLDPFYRSFPVVSVPLGSFDCCIYDEVAAPVIPCKTTLHTYGFLRRGKIKNDYAYRPALYGGGHVDPTEKMAWP
jgi:hypothetical protein